MGGESADKTVVTQAVLPYSVPPEHLQQMLEARGRHRKVRRAIGVAKFDAWATAIFAGLTLVVAGASFSLTGLIVGAAMAFIATQSFRGLNKLVRLDEFGPRLLGYNQLLFAACLIIYAAVNLYQYTVGPGPLAEMISEAPEAKEMLVAAQDLSRQIAQLLYVSLIAVAILGQGTAAWYYFTRGKYVRAYVSETPQWLLEMQRAGLQL